MRSRARAAATGPRTPACTLPQVAAWNVWYDLYGNTAVGFAALNAKMDEACRRPGREPREVRRSACVLVAFDRGGERPHNAPPVQPEELAAHLRELSDAGAEEAILVVDPITERSVRDLAKQLAR